MAEHQPYVSLAQAPAELTARSLVLGDVLGLIFGASSVYLALKIGLTVSASIPIAVLSITIFRALGRATILENNITQTVGSAGESIAAGVVFTIPAILLMGYDLDIGRVAVLATVGGLLDPEARFSTATDVLAEVRGGALGVGLMGSFVVAVVVVGVLSAVAGTAQIAGPVQHTAEDGTTYERWEYIDGWVDSSFVGFLPEIDEPLVTLILIHRPAVWGRYQMAQRPETVYAELMPKVLEYLAVPPDRGQEPVARP